MSLKRATTFLICLLVAGSCAWAANIEVITVDVQGMT